MEFVLGDQAEHQVISHVDERSPHHPLRMVRVLQQTPDADRAVEIREPERELTQGTVAAGVDIFDRDEDHHVEEHQKTEVDPARQVHQQHVERGHVPIGWEALEVMVVGLGVALGELIGRGQQDRTGAEQAHRLGQHIGFDEEERGHEHVIEIVEDVIEQAAVNAVGIGLHIGPARQHAVETVHQHGDDHPDDHHLVIPFKDRQDAEQTPHGAGGGKEMHAPGQQGAHGVGLGGRGHGFILWAGVGYLGKHGFGNRVVEL